MFVIDEELWVNLYIFCYFAFNRVILLVGNCRIRFVVCFSEGREFVRDR